MSTAAQPTGGRWVVGKSASGKTLCVDAIDRRGGKTEICEVWGERDDKSITPVSRANAALLAEAKAMLEALRKAEEVLRKSGMACADAGCAYCALAAEMRAILARIDGARS